MDYCAVVVLVVFHRIVGGVAAWFHGVGAVSYTHLRAHETVLDLVCRLLLEKKKTVKARRHQLRLHVCHTNT